MALNPSLTSLFITDMGTGAWMSSTFVKSSGCIS
jgi:hypothetical protein